MRIFVTLNSSRRFVLPIDHNYTIQSFIYNSISPELAKKLHDTGFQVGKRRFKLFTFSRLMGKFLLEREKKEMVFESPFKIVISSALKQFIEEIGNEMLKREYFKIGRNRVRVNSVEVSDKTIENDKIKVKMLSPITIYSTLLRADGKKKTYYYSPFEKEFSELISQNAKKKFKAFYGEDPKGDLHITPLKVSNGNQKVVFYKGTVIKGWMGMYELSGDRDLIKLVYDTGIGGKNSQGFGCLEVVETFGGAE